MSCEQVPQDTPGWHDIKKGVISSTEISSVMGLSPHRSRSELLRQKINKERSTILDNEAVNWGKKYEPISRQIYEKLTNRPVTVVGLKVHPQHPFLAASPDGLDSGNNLLEIKNVYKRQITRKIPLDYYIQMQIALETWKKETCFYFETKFEESDRPFSSGDFVGSMMENNRKIYWRLVDCWLQPVQRNRRWFTESCLPEIKDFWRQVQPQTCLGKRNMSSSLRRSKRIHHAMSENRDVFLSPYDENAHENSNSSIENELHSYISPSQLRNWVNDDPLLDWLNMYGPNDQKDPKSQFSLPPFIYEKARELRATIVKEQFPTSSVLDLTPQAITDAIDPLILPPLFLPQQKSLQMTLDAFSKGVPVIVNPMLVNHQRRFKCYLDLLVKGHHLKYLGLCTTGPQDLYYPIMIKYSTVRLNAIGKSLLIDPKQKHYMVQSNIIIECLREMQGQCEHCYLIPKGFNYKSKGMVFSGNTPLEKIVQIPYNSKISETLEAALKWFSDLKDYGQAWNPESSDKGSRPIELYPNMKNDQDEPWRTYKEHLARKHKEITKVWHLGIQKRRQLVLEGVHSWDQISNLENLHLDSRADTIYSILNANKHHHIVGLDRLIDRGEIKKNTPVEVFLDFETVTRITDAPNMIFMIGSLVDAPNGLFHQSYQVDRLNLNDESMMVNKWLGDLRTVSDGHKVKVFHWSRAEATSIHQYMKRVCGVMPDWLEFVDLCQIFQNSEIGIPGAFNYGLKEISTSLHRLQLIPTNWEEPLNGLQAMIAVLRCQQDLDHGRCSSLNSSPIIQKLIRYNYTDCRVMYDIVEWIRSCHQMHSQM